MAKNIGVLEIQQWDWDISEYKIIVSYPFAGIFQLWLWDL